MIAGVEENGEVEREKGKLYIKKKVPCVCLGRNKRGYTLQTDEEN